MITESEMWWMHAVLHKGYRRAGINLDLTRMQESGFDKGCDEAYACNNYDSQCLS